jgi:hypothetical protein
VPVTDGDEVATPQESKQATSNSDSESEIEASGATITPNSDNFEDHDPLNTENFETIEDLKQVKKNTNYNHHGNKF